MKRTTHRSSKGTKLYAKRDRGGQFQDLQTHRRASAADQRLRSKAERVWIRWGLLFDTDEFASVGFFRTRRDARACQLTGVFKSARIVRVEIHAGRRDARPKRKEPS